jgi:methyltransferase (TIGR00027 family)
MKNNESEEIKSTAYGICHIRTLLSLLPEEAESLRYDSRTPKFEGLALKQVEEDEDNKWMAGGVEGARKTASDFPRFLESMADMDVTWRGFEFNVCRAHFVDNLLKESIADGSQPIRQIVFCGVGQDYRSMRYGEAIQKHGAKVFELDLPNMMNARETVKVDIKNANKGLVLPETHPLPIDFGKQHVSEVLLAHPAFDPKVPTLYLWEGVSYYLTPDAMRSFFQDIHSLMSQAPLKEREHHRIFFDHLVDLPKLAAESDDGPAKAMLEMFASSEPLQAFLDFDQVESYLASLGLGVHEQFRPPEMYKPFQTAKNEAFHLKPSAYFGIVVAKYSKPV